MSFTMTCSCGAKLRVKDNLSGKLGTCPGCQYRIRFVDSTIAEMECPICCGCFSAISGHDPSFCPVCKKCKYRATQASYEASDFVEDPDNCDGSHLKTAITFYDAKSCIRQLTKLELLERITSLCFCGKPLQSTGVRVLVKSDHLGRLHGLGLASNEVGDAGLKHLAACTKLNQLKALDISDNRFRAAGLRQLMTTTNINALTHVDLSFNSVSSELFAEFVMSPLFRQLTSLDVSCNDISLQSRSWQAAKEVKYKFSQAGPIPVERSNYGSNLASHPSQLTALIVRMNGIDSLGVKNLAWSHIAPTLAMLDISKNAIGDDGVRPIIKSGRFCNLSQLHLNECGLTDRSAYLLASSDFLSQLDMVTLDGNEFTETGISALESSKHNRHLDPKMLRRMREDARWKALPKKEKDFYQALRDRSELTAEERLFIAHQRDLLRFGWHRHVADLAIQCGCFEHAYALFRHVKHFRKMGDIAWVIGDLDLAVQHYSEGRASSKESDWAVFRAGPDWDRLIKLSFFRQRWSELIDHVRQVEIYPNMTDSQVVIGNSSFPKAPYLSMTAIAFAMDPQADNAIEVRIPEWFGVSVDDWRRLRNVSANECEKQRGVLQRRCKPQFSKKAPVSLENALFRGNSERARAAIAYQTVPKDVQAELQHQERRNRLIEYCEQVAAKFEQSAVIDGFDLFMGIIRTMSYVHADTLMAAEVHERLDIRRLSTAEDWARFRLDDWAKTAGAECISVFGNEWRTELRKTWNSPVDTPEWLVLMRECHEWLADRWDAEIKGTQWVSETLLHKLVERAFKGHKVERHAKPIWLAPQHLDIFIPDYNLAVEYMGIQHYEPIEFFGGAAGLRATRERDARKQSICEKAGVSLEYVRHDEDVKTRVQEIHAAFSLIGDSAFEEWHTEFFNPNDD